MKGQSVIGLALGLAAVFVLLAVVIVGGEALGAWDTLRVSIETRQLEALAAADAAEAVRLEALAVLERAQGERSISEAAALSVRKDAQLVTWYALRGDVLKAVVLFLFGVVSCGGVAVLLVRSLAVG